VNCPRSIIIVILFFIFISGCGEDKITEGEPGYELIGRWLLTKVIQDGKGMTPEEAQLNSILTFNSNYTLKRSVTHEDRTITETATWSVTENRLTMNFGEGMIERGFYTVSGNKLTIESEGNWIMEYTKR